jgi:hypothetical protein
MSVSGVVWTLEKLRFILSCWLDCFEIQTRLVYWNITCRMKYWSRRFNVWNCNVIQLYNHMQAGSVHFYCTQEFTWPRSAVYGRKAKLKHRGSKQWRKDVWTNKQFGFLLLAHVKGSEQLQRDGDEKVQRWSCFLRTAFGWLYKFSRQMEQK